MQRYEKYKDSGVDWIGEIPEGWEIRKLKSFLTVHGRIGFRGYTVADLVDKGDGAVTISPSNMFDGNLNLESSSYLSWEKYYESPEIMVEKGDFLLVKTASIGKLAYVRNLIEKATVNPQILVLKNVSICKPFFFYQLLSSIIQKQLNTEKIGSTIFTISERKIKNFLSTVPPPDEQQTIATFLDDKTFKIDQTIANKQKEIELLKERRQILIQKAVTKGLDDTVPLKDSDVDWIGEIPEHWEVRKLRFDFNLSKGLTITKENLTDEGVFCLNYGEIHSKYGFEVNPIIHKLRCVSEEYLLTNSNSLLNEGDFVFADTSEDLEGSGNFTYLNSGETVFAGYHTVIARPKKNIESRFFAYEFDSPNFRNQVRTKMKGVKVFSITQSILKDLTLWIPPYEEQIEITDYLDIRTSKIDQVILLKQQEIEKLKEYKTVLIDNVVTGKVRVS